MNINLFAVLAATTVQFAVGGFWYGGPFGNIWGKMHGFDKLSKSVQEKMKNEMGPYYGLQLLVTVITSVVMGIVHANNTTPWNLYELTGLIWIGFVVPAQASGVIFSNTETKWMLTKFAIQAGGSLACLMAAAVVFSLLA